MRRLRATRASRRQQEVPSEGRSPGTCAVTVAATASATSVTASTTAISDGVHTAAAAVTVAAGRAFACARSRRGCCPY
jgi:hypothetical protein